MATCSVPRCGVVTDDAVCDDHRRMADSPTWRRAAKTGEPLPPASARAMRFDLTALRHASALTPDDMTARLAKAGMAIVLSNVARFGLTLWEADTAAVACGMHPGNVWPEWWEAPVDDGAHYVQACLA